MRVKLQAQLARLCLRCSCLSRLGFASGIEVVFFVENNRYGGNDRRRGFYAPEWNGLSGARKFVLSGDEDHN